MIFLLDDMTWHRLGVSTLKRCTFLSFFILFFPLEMEKEKMKKLVFTQKCERRAKHPFAGPNTQQFPYQVCKWSWSFVLEPGEKSSFD